MKIFLLVVVLVGQNLKTSDDYYFVQSVENFVINNTPKDELRLSRHLPNHLNEIVQDCLSNCYKCRERAFTLLRKYFKKNPDKIRYAFWLLRTRDPALRGRVSYIIMEISECHHVLTHKTYGNCLNCKKWFSYITDKEDKVYMWYYNVER